MIEFTERLSYNNIDFVECKVVWNNSAHKYNNLLIITALKEPGSSPYSSIKLWDKLPNDYFAKCEFKEIIENHKQYSFRWANEKHIIRKLFSLDEMLNGLQWEVRQ